MYEHDLRILGGVLGLTQITCGGFEPDNPSISSPSFGKRARLRRRRNVVRRSTSQLPASLSMPARRCGRSIRYYPETGRIRQVTHCTMDCTNPSISHNARMIAFQSTADLLDTNGGVPFSLPTIYQGDLRQLGPTCTTLPCPPTRKNRGLTNLTPIGGGRNASQNFAGKFVAFESDGDPLNNGGNPWDLPDLRSGRQEEAPRSRFPPASNFPARNPSLDKGRRVAYEIDVPRPGPSPSVSHRNLGLEGRAAQAPCSAMSLTKDAQGQTATVRRWRQTECAYPSPRKPIC